MDPVEAKFFQSSFEISNGLLSLQLKGLISERGVTKIHIPAGLPSFWRNHLGKTVTMTLDRFTIQAVLLEQFVEGGSYFELRFRGTDTNQRNYIRQRIESEGIKPGWQRKFPRIPIVNANDPDLPVPNLCMVRFVGEEHFVNVVNFTLGGMRVETLGDELAELRVGSIVHFDLMSNSGTMMSNLSAEVRNLAVHEQEKSGTAHVTRSFGLRLIDMDTVNEKKYRELIRDHCLELQKRLTKG